MFLYAGVANNLPVQPMNSALAPHPGPRVKYAREKLGLTQDDIKDALGFKDRQIVSSIETGKRALKSDELLKLSDLLDQDLEFFLDPFSVVAEARYSWRASPALDGAELDRFENAANGWVGLLRWLRAQDPKKAAPLSVTLNVERSSTYEEVQQRAEELVAKHGLGPIPAEKLIAFIEGELDIPVMFVETGEHLSPGQISGAACQLSNLGVVLINRRESPARRYFDLAHELFHLLTWHKPRMAPEHRESNSVEDRQDEKRVEELANNFAAALLMPTESLDALVDPANAEDVPHLFDVATRLCVTPEAFAWRLFNLKRISAHTRVALAAQRRSGAHYGQPPLFSEWFVRALHAAADKGRLSPRKAAKTLNLELNELVSLCAVYGLSNPFRS